QLLLVLDNCEHLRDACAELAGDLLAVCPGLRILATSREPLGLTGEAVYRVPMLGEAAVRLFTQRAEEAGGAIAAGDREFVASICRRMDGLPLAIELAAAAATLLSPREVDERLRR